MAEMIAQAAHAGADFAKFQSYQVAHLSPADPQFDWLSRCELTDDDHVFIRQLCAENKIGMMTTVFHEDRVPFLYDLGLRDIKIGSGEAMRGDLLAAIGAHPWDGVYVSTGLVDSDDEIEQITATSPNVVLVHTATRYPTPDAHAALGCIEWLSSFGYPVGYSDHTTGIVAACAACALGAYAVEVHMAGPARSQAWDKSPGEVAALVEFARRSSHQISWDHRATNDKGRQRFIGRWDYRG
jgi:N,N'-diacetyllegionaminate synthase